MTPQPGQFINHPIWGRCEFVRIEGTDWIVRPERLSGRFVRLPPTQRAGVNILSTPSNSPTTLDDQSSQLNTPSSSSVPGKQIEHPTDGACEIIQNEGTDRILRRADGNDLVRLPSSRQFPVTPIRNDWSNRNGTLTSGNPTANLAQADPRAIRKLFESLRTGLAPHNVNARHLAVGLDSVVAEMNSFLAAVDELGGSVIVLRGAYGQGKTFSLRVLREMALEQGYLLAQAEVDATENRLDNPPSIYRSLMGNLQIPGVSGQGAMPLIEYLSDNSNIIGQTRESLIRTLQCEPLAWLLCDPDIADKPDLIRLLAGEPGVRVHQVRKSHHNPCHQDTLRGRRHDWTSLTAATQGDFVSYLLSGIGRLARLIGFKGLILILDEMERWQNLNWRAKSRASNLIGGLIWGATAESHRRGEENEPQQLIHSARNGGYPFSTIDRCHIGVAIATTPRGETGPEQDWEQFGQLTIVDLPNLTPERIDEYAQRLAPLYARAFTGDTPDVVRIADEARRRWQENGDGSMRTAVQQVIAAFDAWREQFRPEM